MFQCTVQGCDREFSSKVGRGKHFSQGHTEDEIRETLLLEIKEKVDNTGEVPSGSDVTHSTDTYQRHFESWNNAIREAGFVPPNEVGIQNEQLIEEIKRLESELGHIPTRRDMESHGQYSSDTYKRRFGSWNKALGEAGYEDRNLHRNVSREDLISEINRLHNKLGTTPTQAHVREHSVYATILFQKEFGSWNDALECAGYNSNNQKNIPKQEIIDDIKSVAERVELSPTCNDMREYGTYSVSTCMRKFGSWNNALSESGLDPNLVHDGSNERLNYGESWESISETVRSRDGNECRVCGNTSNDIYFDKLPVHHIQPAREFDAHKRNVDTDYDRMNELSNLVTLCTQCHMMFEGMWTECNMREFVERARDVLD
jgi:5-methylcytosine-specific restriction endonuclease McrA